MPDKQLTPRRLFDGDLKWIGEHIWIWAKSGELERLSFNQAQSKVIEAARSQLDRGRPIRLIILKGRQLGVSTFVQALFHARTARRKGVKAELLSHQDDSKRKIWAMQKTFVNNSGRRPFVERFGAVEGPLVWNHGSRISCMTAGGKGPGHGETINALHLSEAARYGEGQTEQQQAQLLEMVAGVHGAVARGPGSIEIIESTANGYGNWFEQQWHKAQRRQTDFVPVFIGWFEDPDYRRPLAWGPLRQDTPLTDHEKDLVEQHGLDREQLNWRRAMIATDFNGDERKFREQYPSDAEEAFLVSGSPVFDPDRLAVYRQHVREPQWRGDILFEPPRGWILAADDHGPLKIWQQSRPGYHYVIGGDVAECHGSDSDYDAAVVRCVETSSVVAQLHGRWELGDFARRLAALAWYYRKAILAPEVNGPGVAVIGSLLGKLGGLGMYDNLYRSVRVDKASGKRSSSFGWRTTRQTKAAMVEAESTLLRHGYEACPSADILAEAQTFVDLGGGRMGAQQGAHDDLVMAWCISAAIAEWASVPANPQNPHHPTAQDHFEEIVRASDEGHFVDPRSLTVEY